VASKTIIIYNQTDRIDDVEVIPLYEWIFKVKTISY
jgi:hypothetical protein